MNTLTYIQLQDFSRGKLLLEPTIYYECNEHYQITLDDLHAALLYFLNHPSIEIFDKWYIPLMENLWYPLGLHNLMNMTYFDYSQYDVADHSMILFCRNDGEISRNILLQLSLIQNNPEYMVEHLQDLCMQIQNYHHCIHLDDDAYILTPDIKEYMISQFDIIYEYDIPSLSYTLAYLRVMEEYCQNKDCFALFVKAQGYLHGNHFYQKNKEEAITCLKDILIYGNKEDRALAAKQLAELCEDSSYYEIASLDDDASMLKLADSYPKEKAIACYFDLYNKLLKEFIYGSFNNIFDEVCFRLGQYVDSKYYYASQVALNAKRVNHSHNKELDKKLKALSLAEKKDNFDIISFLRTISQSKKTFSWSVENNICTIKVINPDYTMRYRLFVLTDHYCDLLDSFSLETQLDNCTFSFDSIKENNKTIEFYNKDKHVYSLFKDNTFIPTLKDNPSYVFVDVEYHENTNRTYLALESVKVDEEIIVSGYGDEKHVHIERIYSSRISYMKHPIECYKTIKKIQQ